ncbi:class I SAM-dependent methyltransferase [Streptomyces sp. NPDC002490]|uniref:class I SAM-dependent methyltransferase n=1 Tax=Streptomyces sp. NPDC002490 TaxID=3154416 RepID=UPI00331E40EC
MTPPRSAPWTTYPRNGPPALTATAPPPTTSFGWTLHPGHGPGTEVLALRPGRRVLDLGCGAGRNLAHLAALGMRAVGVDASAVQLARAREHWEDVVGMELHWGDALAFLAHPTGPFDAVYSVFGAAYSTAPGQLLPAVHGALAPGGVFAMSQHPAVDGCYGCQASYVARGPDEDPAVVKRWDYPAPTWVALLEEHGFEEVTAVLLPPPRHGARRLGTLLVRGVRGG